MNRELFSNEEIFNNFENYKKKDENYKKLRDIMVGDLFYVFIKRIGSVFDKVKGQYEKEEFYCNPLNKFRRFLIDNSDIAEEIDYIRDFAESEKINKIINNKLKNVDLFELFNVQEKTLNITFEYSSIEEIKWVLVDFLGQIVGDIKTFEMLILEKKSKMFKRYTNIMSCDANEYKIESKFKVEISKKTKGDTTDGCISFFFMINYI